MDCKDIAAILDDHAQGGLTPAERCALDAHVAACEPCALAWRAQSALLALPVPATPARMLERALQALDPRPARAPRRAGARVAVVGAVLAAGAALAAVTAVKLIERTNRQPATASSVVNGPVEPAQTPAPAPLPGGGAGVGASATEQAVDLGYVDSDFLMAQRTPPVYPREALDRGLEGNAVVKFTIDEHGAVRDAQAVSSSDPLFEAPALAAVAQWKYLPRISGGKRVAVHDIETMIRFQLDRGPLPGASKKQASLPLLSPQQLADLASFDRGITLAWQRAAADDLRGAELVLDELRATYDPTPFQATTLWTFYGYIYTLYGDYGRAIDAYQQAVARDAQAFAAPWTQIATLFMARHQYDLALKTLLAYREQARDHRISPAAERLIAQLRELGVTEETLSPL